MTFTRGIASGLAIAAALAAFPASAQSARELAAMRAQIEALKQLVEQQNAVLEAQSRRLTELETVAEQQKADPPVTRSTGVRSGQGATRLQVYGQVNRGILYGSNGDQSEAFFVDNNASSTRFGFIGEADLAETTVGANIEIELISNNSNANPTDGKAFGPDDGSFNLRERKLEIYAKNKTYGNLWLGQGSTAADGIQEIDLGGTAVAGGYSDINVMAGALRFDNLRPNPDPTKDGSVVRVRNAFSNLDRGRDDRIRYDTPSFMGFTASGSVARKGESDLALRWSGDFGDGVKAAAGGFVSFPDNIDLQYGGSGSILYKGVSLTAGAAAQDTGDARDPFNVYGKLGYDFKPFDFGATSVAVDYSYGEDIQVKGDEVQSIGLFAVQRIDAAATEVYLGYRFYGLDADAGSFGDIHAVLTGARLRF